MPNGKNDKGKIVLLLILTVSLITSVICVICAAINLHGAFQSETVSSFPDKDIYGFAVCFFSLFAVGSIVGLMFSIKKQIAFRNRRRDVNDSASPKDDSKQKSFYVFAWIALFIFLAYAIVSFYMNVFMIGVVPAAVILAICGAVFAVGLLLLILITANFTRNDKS